MGLGAALGTAFLAFSADSWRPFSTLQCDESFVLADFGSKDLVIGFSRSRGLDTGLGLESVEAVVVEAETMDFDMTDLALVA